jgi:hypothetical protein
LFIGFLKNTIFVLFLIVCGKYTYSKVKDLMEAKNINLMIKNASKHTVQEHIQIGSTLKQENSKCCKQVQDRRRSCSVEQEHRIASIKQETNQNNFFCTYDLYGPVYNFSDAGRYIAWASGMGLGPGNGEFLGPVKWHRADRRVPFEAQNSHSQSSSIHRAVAFTEQ